MTNRLFVLFALTFALLFSGCKSSAPSSMAPTTVATPPAVPGGGQPSTSPPQSKAPPGLKGQASVYSMTPIRTLEVNPPASFAAGELPLNGPIEFKVRGNAGQFLLVHVSLNNPPVTAQLPGTRGQLLRGGGDCNRNNLFLLPQTGSYRVLYLAGQWQANVDFTLFDSNDPIVGPGIRPEQVTMDFGRLAQGPLMAVPYHVFCGEGDESWPTHLALESDKLDFRIMPADAYKRMAMFDPGVAKLEAILRPGAQLAVGQNVIFDHRFHWGAYILSARPQLIVGEGWRGVRWIAGFGGDEEYPRQGLGYVFSGMTNDGRYLFFLSADISHPDQKRLQPPTKTYGTPPRTWEGSDPEKDSPARMELEKSLNSVDPASFQPNLDQLDAVIRSLKLKPIDDKDRADR